MAKVKVTKKELPLLKGGLELDESVLKELVALQSKYRATFKEKIETAQAESLKRYSEKIVSLTKAKADMLKEFNADIKRYQALVKDLEKAVVKAKPKSTSATTKKTVAQKTGTKKAAIKKTPPKKK